MIPTGPVCGRSRGINDQTVLITGPCVRNRDGGGRHLVRLIQGLDPEDMSIPTTTDRDRPRPRSQVGQAQKSGAPARHSPGTGHQPHTMPEQNDGWLGRQWIGHLERGTVGFRPPPNFGAQRHTTDPRGPPLRSVATK